MAPMAWTKFLDKIQLQNHLSDIQRLFIDFHRLPSQFHRYRMDFEEKKEYSRACQNIYEELIECLVMTDCVKNGGSLKDCLKDPVASTACQTLRQVYFECRKAQVTCQVDFWVDQELFFDSRCNS
jgi:hypothetical protein